jgi:hypothetical protein
LLVAATAVVAVAITVAIAPIGALSYFTKCTCKVGRSFFVTFTLKAKSVKGFVKLTPVALEMTDDRHFFYSID